MTKPLIGLLALGVPVLGIMLAAGTHDLNWLLLILPGMFVEDLLWTMTTENEHRHDW